MVFAPNYYQCFLKQTYYEERDYNIGLWRTGRAVDG